MEQEKETNLAEMSAEDHVLLLEHLQARKPKKILEIGVSAGGTSKFLLENMEKEASLFSVDIATHYYRDKNKEVGFLCKEKCSPERRKTWTLYAGQDISECIEEIGRDIDCIILDTIHVMPGELLSFLSVLPYISDTATLFLHDIALHLYYKSEAGSSCNKSQSGSYCNGLLLNAIHSKDKFHSKCKIPNSAVVLLDKKTVIYGLFDIFNIFCIDWGYIPDIKILHSTRKLIKKNYPNDFLRLYDLAVSYNMRLSLAALRQRSSLHASCNFGHDGVKY